MSKTFEKYWWKLLRKADPAYHNSKTSWSQQGEDLIIDFIFSSHLGLRMPSYLDIGANHPSSLNNTYLFYKKGCRGVSIEPDPNLFQLLNKKRPGDINLNLGISDEDKELDFYMMSSSTLNTFSKTTAEEYSLNKHFGCPEIVGVKKIRTVPVNTILEKYFKTSVNYFISIDVEGWDFEVLSAVDFNKYRPAVLCIETNAYSGNNVDKYKLLLADAGYIPYADTSINSIFLNKERV